MSDKTYITCPKCKGHHGNDWRQCKGECPMPGSPHYSPYLEFRLKVTNSERVIAEGDLYWRANRWECN
jgi:hypothetical protein